MQREPRPAPPPEVQPDDLRASARQLGLKFGSVEGVPSAALHFGAALALAAGPDAGPADTKRAARERERAERAQGLFAAALETADPKLHGDLDAYVAAVTLDNGARLDVQYAHADAVAVAIRIAGGAAADPPSIHGKAALLATLTTTYCAGMGPELLHERFAQLGATLVPRVDPESYGVLLRVPHAHFQEATELALRCMRAPSRDPVHLADTEVRLQRLLRGDDQKLARRARTADLVSPRAPGPLAPWGNPDRVPNLQQRELDQSLRENLVGERWSASVIGPIDVQTTTPWLARRLSDLAREPRFTQPHWDEPDTNLAAELPRKRNGQATFIATWAANLQPSSNLGAQLFARAVAALVGALPGVEVLWHDGDTYRSTAFAAVALRVRADLLDTAPKWLDEAAQSIDDAWLSQALEPAVAEAERTRVAAQAEIAVRAEQITRLRLGASLEKESVEAARKQVVALRAGRPGFTALP
jgi:hypothetical protein